MKCNTAMASVRLFFMLIVLALLTMSQASAATYSLTPNSTPISIPGNTPAALCSGNQGSWSGNTYRCDWNQPFSLQQGDVITSNTAVTIHSNSGMNLTNVTLGNSSNPITLTAESGRTIQLNNSVLYSSIGGGSTQNVVLTNNTIVHGSISVSGTIQSTNSTVMGNIASSSGTIRSTNSTVMGTITSSSGPVTFAGGQAFGHINVQCCKVTVSGGAVIHAGIRAGNNGIDISNSTVTGDLNAGDNEIILTNVTMLSGNISAGSNNVTINGGDITANVTNSNRVFINNGAVVHGDLQARYLVEASNSTIYGDIETTDNFPEGLHHVKLTDSTVYGNVTVRDDWGTIIGNWPSSAIYGDCDYKTVTESLCRPPPLHWKFDEAQWNNSPNQVLDSSTNQRHGSALNGAVTATNNPSPASCTYGDFQRGSSSSYPYVDIGRSAVFHNADNFSFSLWIKMNGADQSGSRQVILAYGDEEGVIDDDDGRFELYRRNSDNALVFAVRMENDNLRYVEATGNVFNGQWHHVAFSYSKTERRMRLYIDNVLVDDSPNQNISNSDDQKTPKKGDDEGLTIGALPDGSRGIKGQIDEVRFLNYELTAAEVATYATETASCAVPDQCFIENFSSTTNWYPTTLNNSTAPSLQSFPSRLRLTTNAQNQSTAITFKRSFPALGNKMTIEFDYYGFGGSGADGVALVLSDATVTPSPGSYGGSLGYAQRNNGNSGFAGGWLGIGFDEFGNYQLPAEGRVGGRTGNNTNWRDSVGIRASASKSYKWLAGTNTLSPGIDTGNNTLGPGHRYRITVDSRITSPSQQVLFKLERRTSSTGSYSTLIDTLNLMAQDQSAPPANLLLSYTGSTGDNTNFHDITNIQVCTQQPSTPIEIGPSVHHFELSYPVQGLTCESSAVTIKACADASCSTLYTGAATLSLNATNSASWGGGNQVTFSDGLATKYLSKTASGDSVISVASSSVATTAAVVCKEGSSVDAACSMTFQNTGLRFSTVPNQVAGVQSSSKVKLQVVRTDTNTGACVARVTPSSAVKVGYQCVNPTTCVAGQTFTVDNSAIVSNQASATNLACQANPNPQLEPIKYTELANRSFNSSAETEFTIKYSDVGQLRLYAQLDLAASGNDPAMCVTQQSNDFIVKPDKITVTAVQRLDGTANPATTNAGNGFVAAGQNFRVQLDVLNREGNRTPNFGRETTAERLGLQNTLAYPSIIGVNCPSGVTPCTPNPDVLVGSAGFTAVSGTGGRFESSEVSWLQAGSINLAGKISDSDYLGAGDTASANPAVLVGRFYPDRFILQSSGSANSCVAGDFTYMSQPAISANAELRAVATNGSTLLTNYNSLPNKTYAGTAALQLKAVNGGTATDLSGRLSGYTAATWQDGVWSWSQSNLSFTKQTSFVPDGPFASLQLGLNVQSELDSRVLTSNMAIGGSAVGSPLNLLFGRLLLKGGNVADPVAAGATEIPLAFSTEYWSGTGFVINTEDSCTLIERINVSFDTVGQEDRLAATGSNYTLIAGVTGGAGLKVSIPLPEPAKRPLNGTWPVFYQAPNWLKFDWLKEPQGQPLVLENPSAEVSVGRFRGNKRQIFWQEKLN